MNILKDVATSMLSYIQPKIEEKIEETVKKVIESTLATTFAKCVDNAVSSALSNFKIHVIDPVISFKDGEIRELKEDNEENSKQNQYFESSMQKLERQVNDLDQYGRRQSIRLNNVDLRGSTGCEDKVLEFLNKVVPKGEKFTSKDIERCHPVGKLNKRNNNQVIVKFRSYKAKTKANGA